MGSDSIQMSKLDKVLYTLRLRTAFIIAGIPQHPAPLPLDYKERVSTYRCGSC